MALFKESIALCKHLGDRADSAACLIGIAAVAAAQDHLDRAVRLFGAAQALLEEVGAVLWPADRIEYEHNLAATRQAFMAHSQLPESSREAEWATNLSEGQAMTLEQAITYALEPEVEATAEDGSPMFVARR
jgi:hypothetical protein